MSEPDDLATFRCSHERTELRRRTDSAGREMVCFQCLRCGSQAKAVSKASVRHPEALPVFDESIREQFRAGVNAAWSERRERDEQDRRSRWFQEHDEYLGSPDWRWRREAVLQRDDFLCQARLHGCKSRAVEVHHIHYKHWQNEPLFELVAVCSWSHGRITQMDRDARGAA